MWLPVKTWDGSQSRPGEDSNLLPTPCEPCSLLLEGLQSPAVGSTPGSHLAEVPAGPALCRAMCC